LLVFETQQRGRAAAKALSDATRSFVGT